MPMIFADPRCASAHPGLEQRGCQPGHLRPPPGGCPEKRRNYGSLRIRPHGTIASAPARPYAGAFSSAPRLRQFLDDRRWRRHQASIDDRKHRRKTVRDASIPQRRGPAVTKRGHEETHRHRTPARARPRPSPPAPPRARRRPCPAPRRASPAQHTPPAPSPVAWRVTVQCARRVCVCRGLRAHRTNLQRACRACVPQCVPQCDEPYTLALSPSAHQTFQHTTFGDASRCV